MSKPLFNTEWISRFALFPQLVVGFSGGLDSTVLLHALASHSICRHQLLAVHINHGISVNSQMWQRHCEQFCLNLGINFIAQSVKLDCSANIEERARTARYGVFSSLLKDNGCLTLAHHLDDQAETLLLQLFRGAGVDGLAAMTESCSFGNGTLLRPFLTHSRQQLEDYAAFHQLTWIEDESNKDIKYSRNYLRQRVMPLLVEKWPGVVGNIAQAAIHCQQAKMNLDDLALLDCQELASNPRVLSISPLKTFDFERVTNVLRVWLKKNQIQLPSTKTFQRLIHEVVLARSDAVPLVSWGTVQVRRYQNHMYLEQKNNVDLPPCIAWTEFPKALLIENYAILSAKQAEQGLMVVPDAQVKIRFREGGEELVWRGQTKQLKKLFQEWGIPPWLRGRIPLIYIDDQLAAVVGFAISDVFFTQCDAWNILNTQVN